MLAGGGTSGELATAAGVDADNAARWADAMVAGGYATLADGRYAPIEEALGLLRGGSILDVRAIMELLVPAGALLPVEAAIRDGAGIRSDEFQAALGMTAERVNVPMYEQLLLSEWIAGHPGLEAALVRRHRRGGSRAGRWDRPPDPCPIVPGVAIRRLRRRCGDGGQANAAAAGEGLANLRFEVVDGRSLPTAAFDLICLFDAFHHMTDPGAVLDGMRAALRPGGSLLLAEAALSGDAAADAVDPTAVLVYGSDLIYCYQESKVAGAPGLGATWPGRGLATLLEQQDLPCGTRWNCGPATWCFERRWRRQARRPLPAE